MHKTILTLVGVLLASFPNTAQLRVLTAEVCTTFYDCQNPCLSLGSCNRGYCYYRSYQLFGTSCANETVTNGSCDGNGLCLSWRLSASPSVDPTNHPSHSPSKIPTATPSVASIDRTESSNDCKRHRKPWHLLSEQERMLYINGYHLLQENGWKIDTFSQTHSHSVGSRQSHSTSAFLPWHRYFLWELETQIRLLGPEYACFGLPYWDWTLDSGNEVNSVLFTTGLGGSGNEENSQCVESGWFARSNYTTRNRCYPTRTNDINGQDCCLKRKFCDTCWFLPFETAPESVARMIEYPEYGQRTGFRSRFEFSSHAHAHIFLGSNSYSHIYTLYAPDDPIFFLLHGFVDFQWALWQDCHDYERIRNSDLTDDSPAYAAYSPGSRPSSQLDARMMFFVLNQTSWSTVSKYLPTARAMHDITEWNITYDKGDFFSNGLVSEFCTNINESWFPSIIASDKDNQNERDRRRGMMEIEADSQAELTWPVVSDSFYENIWESIKNLNASLEEKATAFYRIACQYNRNNAIANGRAKQCNIPDDVQDCSDMTLAPGQDDIDISLEQMLNKRGVDQSECLQEIRTNMYQWAKIFGVLLDLCNGKFDHICV